MRWILAGAALALLLTAAAAQERTADPLADPRLAREFTVEVRAAEIADLTARLSSTLGVRVDAEPEPALQRVSLYAAKSGAASLMRAIAALYRTSWRRTDESQGPRFRLLHNDALAAQARRLGEQRRAAFVARLLQTQQALRPATEAAVAAAVRGSVARRMPFLPPESLADITPDYLRQTLLLVPARRTLTPALVRSSSAWIAFSRLPASFQQLLAGFFLEQTSASGMGARPDPGVLDAAQGRLEYRLLYGDRWTGTMLLARVGAADNWAAAILPSVLYDLPDYSVLYPEAQKRPVGSELLLTSRVRIDTNTQGWDQALAAIAKAAGINVLTDSFPRPEAFRPASAGPILEAATYGELLDQATAYYGMIWWKQGDWYLFRNRMWAEEERAAVPERVLRAISQTVAAQERLSDQNLLSLASLSEEQLLSLHLYGSAAGKIAAPAEAYDYNEIQLVRAALLLYAQMNEPQREMARGSGLPFPVMSAPQQLIFASVAYDRGIILNAAEQTRWGFRLADRFRRERLPAGWAELGSLQMTFDYGSGGDRQTTLALRAPVVETANKPTPAEGRPQ